jgi:hypothetical protein
MGRSISLGRRITALRGNRFSRRLPALGRAWCRTMWGRFRLAGNPWQRGRLRVRRGRLLRRAAIVRVHRRRQRLAVRRTAFRTQRGAARRSLLLLLTGMDSGRLRRHRTATLRVESRVRRLTDRLADRLMGRRNVVGVAATGTGLRRVRRERGPADRIRMAMGAGHPRDQRRERRRGRSWICGSRSCGVRPPAVRAVLPVAIVRRAMADRIARLLGDTRVRRVVAAGTAAAVGITRVGILRLRISFASRT